MPRTQVLHRLDGPSEGLYGFGRMVGSHFSHILADCMPVKSQLVWGVTGTLEGSRHSKVVFKVTSCLQPRPLGLALVGRSTTETQAYVNVGNTNNPTCKSGIFILY